jgi:hypothetical protein
MQRQDETAGGTRTLAPCLLAVACLVLASAALPSTDDKEYQLKAAYLYNFALFTEWPASRFEEEDSPIVLGVVGEDPFGPLLEREFAEQRVGKRPFEICRFESTGDLGECHLLFVSRSEEDELAAIAKRCRAENILSVSEIPGFVEQGGVIGFYLADKRIRFEIHIDEARRHGVKISSKLLTLAKVVRDRDKGERR